MIMIIMRGFVVSPSCGAWTLRDVEKGDMTFQMYVIIDAKRQQTGSGKVKADLC